jgi:coenzyme F420-reducing hydrogenase gamma subunit
VPVDVAPISPRPAPARGPLDGATPDARPTLAVWKFASCDGCQLTLLNCEAELLALADRVQVAYFPEATRAVVAGPYDVSLVEGSITTAEDAERIQQVRAQSGTLVTIGACATAGGIQALRNLADVGELAAAVYPRPDQLAYLARSTPIASHVTVDVQLYGCPIDRGQLLEVLAAVLAGRAPRLPSGSVCAECKRRGTVCVAVADGLACLGPVTRAGCGALCPAHHRGCYGCFGPQDTPNGRSLATVLGDGGMAAVDVERAFRTFAAGAEAFRAATAPAIGTSMPPGDPTAGRGGRP